MDKVTKLNNQSAGRDKLFRLVQYTSKLIWATLENNSSDTELIRKLKSLEYILSTARKLYRFGRFADTLYSTLSCLHIDDLSLRMTISLSKINNAFYLFSDQYIWLGRSGLLKVDSQKWANLSNKFWVNFLAMNLLRDFYEISQILNKLNVGGLNHEIHGRNPKPTNTIQSKLNLLFRIVLLHKDVALDTVKNGCDICLPLTQLGYLSLSPRIIGLLGAISSLAGIVPLLDSSYKLTP